MSHVGECHPRLFEKLLPLILAAGNPENCMVSQRIQAGQRPLTLQQLGAAHGNQGDTVEELCFRVGPAAPAKIDRHINIRVEEVDGSGRGAESKFHVRILFLKIADSRHQPACEKGWNHTDVG